MAGFVLSFAVIGLYWLAHHGLNLLLLGCIAFLPYPTSLVSAAGDQPGQARPRSRGRRR